MSLWEKMKSFTVARYLIKRGWGFHGIAGRLRRRKSVKEALKTRKFDKKTRIFTGSDGVLFYLPEYKKDVVQSSILCTGTYWENDGLVFLGEIIRKYIGGGGRDKRSFGYWR